MIGYSVDRPVASKFSGCRVASVGCRVEFTVNIVYFNFKLANDSCDLFEVFIQPKARCKNM